MSKKGNIYQWDLNKTVSFKLTERVDAVEAHFAHPDDLDALVVRTKKEDEEFVANIPNILLQSKKHIRVWLVNEEQTIYTTLLRVIPRPRPSDYVYTETEILRYESLEKRIKALEEQGTGGNGKPGSDGFSPIANVVETTEGAVITITDKKGTTTATVKNGKDGKDGAKGEKGDKGDTGTKGTDGTSVAIKNISESTVDGGNNVVTFSDGQKMIIKNGTKGSKGDDGYTPIKGKDYFDGQNGKDGADGKNGSDGKNGTDGKTAYQYAQDGGYVGTEEEFAEKLAQENPTKEKFEEEIGKLSREIDDKQPKGNYLTSIPSEYITEDELEEEINMLKAQGVQQVPLIANSVEECTDKTKVYVLKPDYYAYVYGKHTKEVETTVTVPAKASVIVGKRYSFSGGTFQEKSGCSAVIIPIDPTADSCTIEMQNMTRSAYTNVYVGLTADSYDVEVSGTWNEALTSCTLGSVQAIQYNQYKYLVFTASSTAVEGEYNNSKLFYNGKEVELVVTTDPTKAMHESTTTTTQTVTEEGFYNTGCSLFSVDFEKRIIALEKEVSKVNADINLVEFLNSVHCPIQLSANSETDSDFNLHTFADFGSGFHSYFDDLVARYPHYLVREHLGKDSSGTIDMYRYVLGKHYWSAWYKENYPRMYAWKNGNTVIYSVSISPRINENMYSTTYIGTVYSKVTSINATNRSRTVNGLEFVRYEDGDVEPTVYYTSSYNRFSHLVDINENWESKIASIAGNVLTGYENKPLRYIRYPFGDLTKDKKPLIHMTIIANEHGGDTEPAIPSLIVARLIRDLCNGQCSSNNPIYRFLRDNVQITFIPAVNPHGLNKYASGEFDGYYNGNGVNINRNYDTVGWDYCYNNQSVDGNDKLGAYAGSENETQYVMNTMVDSKSVVAMSVHTISCLTKAQTTRCMYQGQNPNGEYTQLKIDEIADDMKSSYNLDFIAYDPLECPPSTTAKSPSFITQIGAYGGIVEMQCHNPLATEEEITLQTTMFTDVVMEQNYSLLLKFIAMWLSDYLESK